MVRETIELGEWGARPSGVWPRSASVGMEVPQHSRRTRRQGRGRHGAMEVVHRVEEAVLLVHQAIRMVRRPVRAVKTVRRLERFALGPHGRYGIEERASRKIRNSPLVQSTHPLGESRLR